MNTRRIIPVLLHKNGRLVLSRNFEMHHDLGDAYQITERLKNWDVDELVYLDITPHWQKEYSFDCFLDTLQTVSKNCFVPLSAGGGLGTVKDIQRLIHAGADRFVLNSAAFENPALISECAHTFGAQAVIVCMDIRKEAEHYICYTHGGKKALEKSPVEWAKEIEARGAGELIIQAMHNDGTGAGYDLALLDLIKDSVSIPLIALGGAGSFQDFPLPLQRGAGGAAAANIFAFQELSYKAAKDIVIDKNCFVRPGSLGVDYKSARHNSTSFEADKNALWAHLDQSGFME